MVAQKERLSLNGQVHTRTVLRSLDDAWQSDIAQVNWSRGALSYELLGWYASSGLAPMRLRMERVIQPTTATWTIVHQPLLSRVAGKESALVTGYNYRSAQRLNVPAGITTVRIVLEDTAGRVLSQKTCQVAQQTCL